MCKAITICLHGTRQYMEDRHLIAHNLYENYHLYAVFDGHGGDGVAEHCRDNLARILKRNLLKTNGDFKTALLETFDDLDESIPIPESYVVGSTCLVVLKGLDDVWVANCGDSRAIMNNGASVADLTRDHKPIGNEKERIERAGGVVVRMAPKFYRVSGELALSRAIGDKKYRPSVIPTPDVFRYTLSGNNQFIVVATDGLWDVMSSNATNAFIKQFYLAEPRQSDVDMLKDVWLGLTRVLSPIIEDNTTAIVVHLRR